MKNKLSSRIDIDEKLLKNIKMYCIDYDISLKDFVTKAVIEKAISLKIYNKN